MILNLCSELCDLKKITHENVKRTILCPKESVEWEFQFWEIKEELHIFLRSFPNCSLIQLQVVTEGIRHEIHFCALTPYAQSLKVILCNILNNCVLFHMKLGWKFLL
jgi:hypothetical protein